MATVDQLQIRLIIQRLVNRGASARVIDVDGATPEVNLMVDTVLTAAVADAGPKRIILPPTPVATPPAPPAVAPIVPVLFTPPEGGATKFLVVVMADAPVQVGLDVDPAGPETLIFIAMPNIPLGEVRLRNNSATVTATAKVFVSGG